MAVPDVLAALKVVERFGMIDGEHHKQWVIDQMLRALLQEDYNAWIIVLIPDYRPWNVGIAP